MCIRDRGDSFWVKLMKPSSFAPFLAFVGIVLYMFVKSEKKKGIGTILLGFAILMSGMETMSSAVKPLADVPQFTALFTMFQNPSKIVPMPFFFSLFTNM